jgi:hypothetical protein
MNSTKLIFTVLTLGLGSAHSATTSISWWHYDQYAQNSPYYTWMGLETVPKADVGSFALLDAGWGYTLPDRNSSYHVKGYNQSARTFPGPLRSIGWHKYEVIVDSTSNTTNLFWDDSLILSSVTVGNPSLFYFVMHDYYGLVQETVIDDFEVRVNGYTIYQQGFDDLALPSGWFPTGQSRIPLSPIPGTYYSPGDTTNVLSGTGSMAVGVNAAIYDAWIGVGFDLGSILASSAPEPSTTLLPLAFFATVTSHRRRLSRSQRTTTR